VYGNWRAKGGSFNARSGEQLTIKKLAKEHLGFEIVTWLSDDETMTRYRHCVVTLTDSQLDPKVRGPAAWPPAECKNSQCARGHASSSGPDVTFPKVPTVDRTNLSLRRSGFPHQSKVEILAVPLPKIAPVGGEIGRSGEVAQATPEKLGIDVFK
jgi:hypothetical protein